MLRNLINLFYALPLVAGLTGMAAGIVYAQENNAQIIGLSLPLSGKAATLGRQYVAGARLALKQLPNGDKIELLISDDGCDGALAELAIDDIRAGGALMITGFLCNEPVYKALDILRDTGIPMLVTGARSNRILKDRKRHSWDVWQSSPRDADVSLAAFNSLGKRWRNIPYAIVDDGTVFGRTQADEFRALMEEAGNKPQFVDNFRPAQSTQAGLIRRLQRSGVEAVYLAAGADDVALIGRNMIEFGPTMEIATGEAVSLLPYIEDNKGIPIGLLAIMPAPPEDIHTIQELIKTIETAKLEPEPYLLLGYATMQIVSAYLDDGERNFSGRKFTTVLGDVEFDDAGRNIVSQYKLYRWNGTKFVRVEG